MVIFIKNLENILIEFFYGANLMKFKVRFQKF